MRSRRGAVAASRRRSAGVTNPSGQAPPSPTLTGWTNVRVEDFNTPLSLGAWPGNQTAPAGYTGWSAYASGWGDTRTNNGDSEGGIHRPEEVLSVSNSCLDWYIHTVAGEHKISAPQPPYTGPGAEGGHLYGRYSVRAKSDLLPAYKTAWLLWPDSEVWPRDGEIDFPEGDLDWQPAGYLHYQDAVSGSEQDVHSNPYGDTYADWHTYTIEWWPNYVKFLLDGKGFGTTWWRTPNTAMHWVLQVETTLGVENIPLDATAGHVQMDWLAQWSHNSSYTPPETIGGSSDTGNVANTVVLTVPTVANGGAYKAPAAGDMLIVTIYTWSASAVSPPAGWTQIGTTQTVAVPGYSMQQRTYWRLWDGSTTSYTFTTTGAQWREALLGMFRGQNATPVDAQNSQTNSTASTSVPNSGVTATDADAIVTIAAIGDSASGQQIGIAPEPGPSGWIAAGDSSGMAVDPVMPGATGPRNGSAPDSQFSLTQVIALK